MIRKTWKIYRGNFTINSHSLCCLEGRSEGITTLIGFLFTQRPHDEEKENLQDNKSTDTSWRSNLLLFLPPLEEILDKRTREEEEQEENLVNSI